MGRYEDDNDRGLTGYVQEISVLIGGKAGDGINQAGPIIGRILSMLGYRIYIYLDYPSLIRGGHNFSIIRGSKGAIGSHKDKVDFILALNQDAVDLHKERVHGKSVIIYDRDAVKSDGVGLPLGGIIKEEGAQPIMRNSILIGALCKACGVEWTVLEDVFKKGIRKETELNLKLARRGFAVSKEAVDVSPLGSKPLPMITGNEAIGLGLIKGGLDAYVAYPMTPASSILHFLAEKADDFNLKVIHPESELTVILMALGFAYGGTRVAVGTSGGGFCLMTEALSLAGLGELPVVIVVSQRPGPSTGVPTYTSQGDLLFVLNAGHGEFVRFVVAPGDPEEAYSWSERALEIAWRFQIQPIVLVDKSLSEGTYSFDIDSVGKINDEGPLLWDRKGEYKRYLDTANGISPMAFLPEKGATIKVNSYTHDEYGITTEDAGLIKKGQDKLNRKEAALIEYLKDIDTVNVYGKKKSSTALLCWGSNKGVCVEAAQELGLKVIQPLVLKPFPVEAFKKAVRGVKKIICVESSSQAQLTTLIKTHGFRVDSNILKYDGRPFALDELVDICK